MHAIDECLDALLRNPLQAVAAGGALGYVGLDIPPDLLLAVPRGSCHLPWRITRATPRADAWLESSFPPYARSMLEDWADGRFDCFEQVLFTRGEDVSQRLYYYVCELQRCGKLDGPRPLIFDIARIDRPASHRYTEAALRQLAQQLRLTDERLNHGITRANAARAMFRQMRQRRRAPGSVYEQIVRASLFADIERARDLLNEHDLPHDRRRIVLGGSSPPDQRIHQLLEACGACVTGEFYDRNLERLGETVPEGGIDPVSAIARGWLQHTFLGRDRHAPEQRLLALVRATQAQAVVLWFAREDEALAWQVPRLRRGLEAASIPALILTARDWDFADGAAQAMQTFLAGLPP
ncbi:MAG TPA: 2-hydroxyacyl-CoA dehydratase family protein [Steroidobacteraceae bacterium]